MAVGNRGGRTRAPSFTWGWIGLGILILAMVAWIVYSFFLIGSEPHPPAVDLQGPVPGQSP